MSETDKNLVERVGCEEIEEGLVRADFARKLERERDEAREQCKALWQLVEIEKKKTYNYRQERDEARQKMADSLQEVDLRTLDFERMKQERDEARGQWKEQHDALLTVMEHGENEMQKLIKERDEARDVVTILCDGKPERPIYFQTDIDEWMERHALAVQECERLECKFDKAHKEFLIANDKRVNAECTAREISSVMEKMKQERDDTRKHLSASNHFLEKYIADRDEAIAERDIARLAALDSDRAHDRMVGELEGVYKDLDKAREDATNYYARVGELESERDDALSQIVQAECRAERFCQERDEARGELNEIRAERDLARLSSMEIDQTHDRMVGELEGVYKQLDEAREALRQQK